MGVNASKQESTPRTVSQRSKLMSTKDDYIAKMNEQLKKFDAEIDQLTGKARQMSAEMQAKYAEQLKTMRENRDAAMKKMQEIQAATEPALQKMKAGMDSAWEAMRKAFDKASSQIKK